MAVLVAVEESSYSTLYSNIKNGPFSSCVIYRVVSFIQLNVIKLSKAFNVDRKFSLLLLKIVFFLKIMILFSPHIVKLQNFPWLLVFDRGSALVCPSLPLNMNECFLLTLTL